MRWRQLLVLYWPLLGQHLGPVNPGCGLRGMMIAAICWSTLGEERKIKVIDIKRR